MQDLINAIKQIPFYQDQNFKNGNRNALTSMSTVHFVIYPYLTALGYNVYSPETVKMQDIVNNGRLDVSLYIQHRRVLGFIVKDYATHQTKESLENAYQSQMIGKDTKEVPITVITNGVNFIYYTGEHKLLAVDLLDIENANTQFLYKISSSAEQTTNLSNTRLLTELRLESSFGDLKSTEFLQGAVMALLKTPDAGFIDMLSRKLHEVNCLSLPVGTIETALLSELTASPTMLFDMLQSSIPSPPVPPTIPSPLSPPAFTAPVEPTSVTEEPTELPPPTPLKQEPKPATFNASDYAGLISADGDDDGEGESLLDLL